MAKQTFGTLSTSLSDFYKLLLTTHFIPLDDIGLRLTKNNEVPFFTVERSWRIRARARQKEVIYHNAKYCLDAQALMSSDAALHESEAERSENH